MIAQGNALGRERVDFACREARSEGRSAAPARQGPDRAPRLFAPAVAAFAAALRRATRVPAPVHCRPMSTRVSVHRPSPGAHHAGEALARRRMFVREGPSHLPTWPSAPAPVGPHAPLADTWPATSAGSPRCARETGPAYPALPRVRLGKVARGILERCRKRHRGQLAESPCYPALLSAKPHCVHDK